MRLEPAFADSSKTRREPSTFSSRVASLASRRAKARWTTTSAPLTRSRTLAVSVTSPCLYSVFFQRRSAGSNGRRAMPTMLLTVRERSRALTMAIPRSPVGPVTATVSRSAAMAGGSIPSGNVVPPLFAAPHDVEPVADEDVVLAAAAVHVVALPVERLYAVVAATREDRVPAGTARHAVVAVSGAKAVLPPTAFGRDVAAGRADQVVPATAEERNARALAVNRVVP